MFENSIKVCFYENAESEGLVYVSPFGETRYFFSFNIHLGLPPPQPL